MAQRFDNLKAVYAADFDDLIDVRSPAEFAEDHIPGAISLPVLSNAERAEVGTIYTQIAPFQARKVGAAKVARNAATHIEGPLADKDGSWRPLVYCWRGGQRSGSFASILAQIGWRTDTIEGGYQSYRRLVVGLLRDRPLPHKLVLLDGNTGTAKTEILAQVKARGGQVLDLEGLAAHRGSLFGGVSRPQPAQKGFESALARALTDLDPNQVTVVEAESSKIGDLLLPSALWKAMCGAPRISVSAPLASRARYLATAYADLTQNTEALRSKLDLLVPFQGHDQVLAWQEMARTGAFEQLAADLMQRHYDSRYAKSRAANPRVAALSLDLPGLSNQDLQRAADQILAFIS